MNKLLRTSPLKKFLFLVWSLSCVAVFISYPGMISYTQLSILHKWQDLPLKVMRIEPFLYVWNFAGALIGVFLFSLACVSLGFLLIKLLGILQQNNASEFYDRA